MASIYQGLLGRGQIARGGDARLGKRYVDKTAEHVALTEAAICVMLSDAVVESRALPTTPCIGELVVSCTSLQNS